MALEDARDAAHRDGPVARRFARLVDERLAVEEADLARCNNKSRIAGQVHTRNALESIVIWALRHKVDPALVDLRRKAMHNTSSAKQVLVWFVQQRHLGFDLATSLFSLSTRSVFTTVKVMLNHNPKPRRDCTHRRRDSRPPEE